MYTVYTIPGSCSNGVTALLEKLGLDYLTVKRDDVANFTDIVLTNQVPAIKTPDGMVIAEGAEIVLYLIEKHGPKTLSSSIEEKAKFYELLMFNYATLHVIYSKLFNVAFALDMSEPERQSVLEQYADKATATWAIVNKRLGDKLYMMGNEPSVIDYLLAIYTSWNNNLSSVNIELGDKVIALMHRVSELPEFIASYAKEGVTFNKVN